MDDPFGYVDRLHFCWRGRDFNIFRYDAGVRRFVFWLAVACLVLWVMQGFDSNPYQLFYAGGTMIEGLWLHTFSWTTVVKNYDYYYGKLTHYSTFATYLFLYWALSRNWARLGITKTKNVVYSFAITVFAIGLFEWFWLFAFAYFQNQPWIITWQMPQMSTLLGDSIYVLIGLLAGFYMWIDSCVIVNHEVVGRNWIFPWKTLTFWVAVILSAASVLLWIYYPLPVHLFSVALQNGQFWHSSKLFPQTLYTIKVTSQGSNSGVWFYFSNNLIHLVNITVKSLWALTVYFFFKVTKKR